MMAHLEGLSWILLLAAIGVALATVERIPCVQRWRKRSAEKQLAKWAERGDRKLPPSMLRPCGGTRKGCGIPGCHGSYITDEDGLAFAEMVDLHLADIDHDIDDFGGRL